MSETIIERIAKALDVEVDDLPTYVASEVHKAYLAEHWETMIKPTLLRLVEELETEMLIKQRLERWVSGTGRDEEVA